MNIYRALPAHLTACADATAAFLAKDVGLSSFRIEEEIHPGIDFRPTIHAITSDKHILCAEVVEHLFDVEVERFVMACKNQSIPVKLYVAIQKGLLPQVETRALKFARENGVSIIEISPPNTGAYLTHAPLSLSLGGLRAFNLQSFPKKYRGPLGSAIDTFRQGNPIKGCSQVYDELEALTRRIGRKCASIPSGLKKAPGFDWNTESWAVVLEFMKVNLDRTVVDCPELKPMLLTRIIGLTEYRNDAGHKPSSVQKLIERDRQARTRFESAMDELSALVRATTKLRV